MKFVLVAIALFTNALFVNAQNPNCGVLYDKGSNNYNCCQDSYCFNSYSLSAWKDACNADAYCKYDDSLGRCTYDSPFSYSCVHYGNGKGKGYYPSKGKGYYPAPSKGKGYYSPVPISKGKGYTPAVPTGKGYDYSGKGKGKGAPEPYAEKCYGFSKKKCKNKDYCGWDPYYYKCYDLYPPVGKGKGKGKGTPNPTPSKGKGKGKGVPGPGECYGYNKNKCNNSPYCMWNSNYKVCLEKPMKYPVGKGKGKGTPNPTPGKGKGKGGVTYECYGLKKNFCKMYNYCKWDNDNKMCKDKKSNNVVKCNGLKKNKCKDAINCKWQPNKYGNRVCMDRKHW